MEKLSMSKPTMTAIPAIGLLLVLLIATVGTAEPTWGPIEPWISYKVTASGIHFAKDPLLRSDSLPALGGASPAISGWVRFTCADDRVPSRVPRGFQYHIGAQGLEPHTTYEARAYPLPGSQDHGDVDFYELGTVRTNSKGEGKASGFIDLDTGPFAYRVTVELDGTPVLTTLPPGQYDGSDLPPIPLPFPPFDLGDLLWLAGDHVDGFVVE
jgi:hypothetical protein